MFHKKSLGQLVRIRFLILLTSLVTLMPRMSEAQMTVTGTITGTVRDQSGQVIVGARLSLLNPKTGEIRTAVTNETGDFSFVAVRPDVYTLKTEQGGFKSFEQ